jgi:hypothetical protein
MKLRKAAQPIPPSRPPAFVSFLYILVSLCWLAAGCGVPGDPIPPSPPIPVAVTDLSGHQLGDGVLLIFTPPKKSTRGERLGQLPTLEILRGSLRPDGRPDPNSFRVVDTVPGSLLGSYMQDDKVHFLEPVPPVEIRAYPGETLIYRVRTRISERKASADSNDVSLQLFTVPERIETVEALVTENSIQLSWPAPKRTSTGEPLPAIQEYHVFRGELDPASAAAAQKDLHAAAWKLPLLQIASTSAPEYQDTGFDYGKTYAYVVRSVININGATLESGDSRPAILTPKDIFPPAAPQDVVAALLPGASPGTLLVDLSWAINLETDMAGYRVYRSERGDERGQLLTPDLLPTSAYRDSSVLSGRRYWYTVTAVDRAGNESAPSTTLLVEIP